MVQNVVVGEVEATDGGNSLSTPNLKAIRKAGERDWKVSYEPGREKTAGTKKQFQDMWQKTLKPLTCERPYPHLIVPSSHGRQEYRQRRVRGSKEAHGKKSQKAVTL